MKTIWKKSPKDIDIFLIVFSSTLKLKLFPRLMRTIEFRHHEDIVYFIYKKKNRYYTKNISISITSKTRINDRSLHLCLMKWIILFHKYFLYMRTPVYVIPLNIIWIILCALLELRYLSMQSLESNKILIFDGPCPKWHATKIPLYHIKLSENRISFFCQFGVHMSQLYVVYIQTYIWRAISSFYYVINLNGSALVQHQKSV